MQSTSSKNEIQKYFCNYFDIKNNSFLVVLIKSFLLHLQIRRICLLNLNDGKPKDWPSDLKYDIINYFIHSDKELQHLLKARDGIWSAVVGFFQWLLSIIGFM